jgi:cysteine synthase A
MSESILAAVGNTSLVQLRHVVPNNGANIFAKLEWQNPTGSMKDRMALGLISKMEAERRIKRGDTIIEYTGGSTGTSLAFVCGAKGYKMHAVSCKAFSQEKLDHMTALGAQLTLVPYDGQGMRREMFLQMIAAAKKLASESNMFWVNQIENPDTILGYIPLGEEIWKQTDGKVDAFVQPVGTGASLRGVAMVLKRYKPNVKIIAWEPAESPVLSGGERGAHDIEGIGIGYRPALWDESFVDDVLAVSTEEAKAMARRVAREEGIFAGTSSGGNICASLRVAERLAPNSNVVTLSIDSGLKYVSTDLYRTGE